MLFLIRYPKQVIARRSYSPLPSTISFKNTCPVQLHLKKRYGTLESPLNQFLSFEKNDEKENNVPTAEDFSFLNVPEKWVDKIESDRRRSNPLKRIEVSSNNNEKEEEEDQQFQTEVSMKEKETQEREDTSEESRKGGGGRGSSGETRSYGIENFARDEKTVTNTKHNVGEDKSGIDLNNPKWRNFAKQLDVSFKENHPDATTFPPSSTSQESKNTSGEKPHIKIRWVPKHEEEQQEKQEKESSEPDVIIPKQEELFLDPKEPRIPRLVD